MNIEPYDLEKAQSNISKNNRDLAELVRAQIDDTLMRNRYKYGIWNECYLEYHGIGVDTFVNGNKFHTAPVHDPNTNAQVSKKIYDRKVKLGNGYATVSSSMAQLYKGLPDFFVLTRDPDLKDVAKNYEQLIKYDWTRSKSHLEYTGALWNYLIFGEMVFRTFYDEEKQIIGEDQEEKIVYRGNKAKMVNSFEFLPSPDWRLDLQECAWVATRKFITPQEALDMYPDEFSDIEDASRESFYGSDTRNKVLDPYLLIRDIYASKIDPETKECISGMAKDLNMNRGVESDQSIMVELIEYFNKDMNAHVVMIGDTIVEAHHMEEAYYPFAAYKANVDPLTGRGVGDMEQALPLIRVADDLFDIKMKNLLLQLSTVMVFDKKYLQETPTFSTGTAIGVKLRTGDSLDNVIRQVPKYGQNFEIQREQKDIEFKLFKAMGSNEFIAGSPNPSVEATAKESLIKQAAATANLSYKLEEIHRHVLPEVAKHWIGHYNRFYNEDFSFPVLNNGNVEYIKFIGDVEIKEKSKYYEYKYKGLKFYREKRKELVLEQLIDEYKGESEEGFGGIELLTNDDIDVLGQRDIAIGVSQPQELPEADVNEPLFDVPESVVDSWDGFLEKLKEKDPNISAIITSGELDIEDLMFEIKVAQDIALNREIKTDRLMKIFPFISQMQDPEANKAILKALFEQNGLDPMELAPTLFQEAGEGLQQTPQIPAPQGGPGGNPIQEALRPENLARQGGANGSTIDVNSLPGNPEQTQNPGGSNF